MKTLTTSEIGRYGENAAARFLRRHGYKILERNYRAGRNEIDIIAKNKDFLVFVEVKTRSEGRFPDSDFGIPSEAVDEGKQRRTIAAAEAYLYKNESDGEMGKMIRFDIIEVYLKRSLLTRSPAILKIEHIEDAFWS